MKKNITKTIQKMIQECLLTLFQYEIYMEDISVEEPKKEEHGDYTTNIALNIAKVLKKKPMDLAEQIAEYIKKKVDFFENLDIVNPGFINFFLKDPILLECLNVKEEDEEKLNKIHLKNLLQKRNIKSKLSLSEIKSVQYVHSRTFSIIKIFEDEGVYIKGTKQEVLVYEMNRFEKMIIKKILEYPYMVKQVVVSDNPQKMIQYIFELNEIFYKFQEKTLFRKLDKNRLSVTLEIVDHIRKIVKDLLNVLGIDAPEKM